MPTSTKAESELQREAAVRMQREADENSSLARQAGLTPHGARCDPGLDSFTTLGDESRKGARRELEFAAVSQLPPESLQQSRVPMYTQQQPATLQTPSFDQFSDVGSPLKR